MYKNLLQHCQLGSEGKHQIKPDVNKSKTEGPIRCKRNNFMKFCKRKVSKIFEEKNSESSKNYNTSGNELNKDINH